MYETKIKPLKKLFAIAIGFIMVFAILSGKTFAPSQEKSEERVSQSPTQTVRITSPPPQTPPAVTYTPTPAPIVEEPIEEPEVDPNPYAELVLTEAEKEWLACMAHDEANDQEFEGQIAVVQVALNRVLHPKFPDNIFDVLFSPHQFCVGNYYDEQQMKAVEAALSGDPVLDLNTDVVFFSTGKLKYGSYYKTIGDHVFRTYS